MRSKFDPWSPFAEGLNAPWLEDCQGSLIARFMGPTWGPSGADRTQVGPMLASLILLSGWYGNGVCHLAAIDSSALAMELRLSSTNPSIWSYVTSSALPYLGIPWWLSFHWMTGNRYIFSAVVFSVFTLKLLNGLHLNHITCQSFQISIAFAFSK